MHFRTGNLVKQTESIRTLNILETIMFTVYNYCICKGLGKLHILLILEVKRKKNAGTVYLHVIVACANVAVCNMFP